MQRSVSPPRAAALLALLLFASAVAGFGALHPEFSQVRHPVAALGASGVRHAWAFDTLAFVLPGVLNAFVAAALRKQLGAARWSARLGAQALMIASLAFAAQGLFRLDSRSLMAPASQWHGAVWTFWWVAFAAGAVLLAVGTRATSSSSAARASLVFAGATLAGALVLPGIVGPGIAQRLAFAAWFVAMVRLAPRQP